MLGGVRLTGSTLPERLQELDRQRLYDGVESLIVALYFPLLFLGTITAPNVLTRAFGVPFFDAVAYALVAGLVAYVGGLAALCR